MSTPHNKRPEALLLSERLLSEYVELAHRLRDATDPADREAIIRRMNDVFQQLQRMIENPPVYDAPWFTGEKAAEARTHLATARACLEQIADGHASPELVAKSRAALDSAQAALDGEADPHEGKEKS